jgi:hypothetical protein
VNSLNLQTRALRQAAEIEGSTLKLSQRLRVSYDELIEWQLGATPPPRLVFLRAVDIIVEHQDEFARFVRDASHLPTDASYLPIQAR